MIRVNFKYITSHLLLGIAVILLTLYQLNASKRAPKFVNAAALSWTKLDGCAPQAVPSELNDGTDVLGTFGVEKSTRKYSCKTALFPAQTSLIALELYSSGKGRFVIDVRDEQNNILSRHEVYASALPPNWDTLMLRLDSVEPGQLIYLRISSIGKAEVDFALRNRLSFYREGQLGKLARDLATNASGKRLLCTALAATLVLLVFLLPVENWSVTKIFLSLFFISLAIHFRLQTFFYWDEWFVLERYMRMGLPGVVYTHNEHFLPLFFSFFFVETKLFGVHYPLYILVSFALHAINALLLILLAKRLLPGLSTKGSFVLGLLFVTSALNSESLHWAFEQSLLLSQLCLFGAALAGTDYIRRGARKNLAILVFALVCTPLFFGNGFVAFIQVPLILLFATFLAPSADALIVKLKRLGLAAIIHACAVIPPVVLYLTNKEGAGHGVASANPWANLRAVFDYLLTGSQLGTVLRGLSIFPALEPTAVTDYYNLLQSNFPTLFTPTASPILVFSWLGLVFSIALLALSLFVRRSFQTVALWVLGQLIIGSALVLPAFGRWQLGVEQSLSLRYHYNALAGLMVMLIPLASFAASRTSRQRLSQALCVFLLSAIVAVQLYLGLRFNFFAGQGLNHRRYFEALDSWKRQSEQQAESNVPPPAFPKTITPGRSAEQVYRTYRWLTEPAK